MRGNSHKIALESLEVLLTVRFIAHFLTADAVNDERVGSSSIHENVVCYTRQACARLADGAALENRWLWNAEDSVGSTIYELREATEGG